MVFKDCKVQKIVSFLMRFQGGCTRLKGVVDPLVQRHAVIGMLYSSTIGHGMQVHIAIRND